MEPSGNGVLDEAPNRRLRSKHSGTEATGFVDLIESFGIVDLHARKCRHENREEARLGEHSIWRHCS